MTGRLLPTGKRYASSSPEAFDMSAIEAWPESETDADTRAFDASTKDWFGPWEQLAFDS
jgi:hypothetical protein